MSLRKNADIGMPPGLFEHIGESLRIRRLAATNAYMRTRTKHARTIAGNLRLSLSIARVATPFFRCRCDSSNQRCRYMKTHCSPLILKRWVCAISNTRKARFISCGVALSGITTVHDTFTKNRPTKNARKRLPPGVVLSVRVRIRARRASAPACDARRPMTVISRPSSSARSPSSQRR